MREPKEFPNPNPVTGFDFGNVNLEAIGPDGRPVKSNIENEEVFGKAEAPQLGLSREQKEWYVLPDYPFSFSAIYQI